MVANGVFVVGSQPLVVHAVRLGLESAPHVVAASCRGIVEEPGVSRGFASIRLDSVKKATVVGGVQAMGRSAINIAFVAEPIAPEASKVLFCDKSLIL